MSPENSISIKFEERRVAEFADRDEEYLTNHLARILNASRLPRFSRTSARENHPSMDRDERRSRSSIMEESWTRRNLRDEVTKDEETKEITQDLQDDRLYLFSKNRERMRALRPLPARESATNVYRLIISRLKVRNFASRQEKRAERWTTLPSCADSSSRFLACNL